LVKHKLIHCILALTTSDGYFQYFRLESLEGPNGYEFARTYETYDMIVNAYAYINNGNSELRAHRISMTQNPYTMTYTNYAVYDDAVYTFKKCILYALIDQDN
jgi:hypothetical protein